MHILCGLRRDQAPQRMPELWRRFCATADPACQGMAARTNGREAARVGQARASVVQPRRYRCAFLAYQEYSAGRALSSPRTVIARSAATKQSSLSLATLDCFASPVIGRRFAPTRWLATTESFSRRDRPFDLTKPDAIAVALAPAAHDKRIAVFEKFPLDHHRQLTRLGAVPADPQKAAALVLLRATDGAAPQEIADIHGAS